MRNSNGLGQFIITSVFLVIMLGFALTFTTAIVISYADKAVNEHRIEELSWADKNNCKVIESYFKIKKYRCVDSSIHWRL